MDIEVDIGAVSHIWNIKTSLNSFALSLTVLLLPLFSPTPTPIDDHNFLSQTSLDVKFAVSPVKIYLNSTLPGKPITSNWELCNQLILLF